MVMDAATAIGSSDGNGLTDSVSNGVREAGACHAIAVATDDAERAGRLTVRDCARLQGFPDDIEFVGDDASQFRQIGNAVPPLLGGAIARSLWTALYGEAL